MANNKFQINEENLIPLLKEFINREQDAQNSEIERIWSLPAIVRETEGECIRNVTVIDCTQFNATLRWEENHSKFRTGDILCLNSGEPHHAICSCEIIEEFGNQMKVRASINNNFLNLEPGNQLVADRGKVDIRHIQLGILDKVAENPYLLTFFCDLFSGKSQPIINHAKVDRALKQANQFNFNKSQTEAFSFSYASENFYLIQGPPGTGKTWVLAYLAALLAQEGQRVLVTAFTHRAINNALIKIAETTNCANVAKIGQWYQANDSGFEKNHISNYENLDSSPYKPNSEGVILGATCFSLRTKRLQSMQFDTVIFDEAGQMPIPLAMIGISAAGKAIFVGDHQQMPPIIAAKHSQEWVTKSIFEILFSHAPSTMLNTTYRMNEVINRFPSKYFYNNQLITAPDTTNCCLELKSCPKQYSEILDPEQPDVYVKVNHNDCKMRSPEEAEIAAGIVIEAIACGIPANEIAIVTPYRAQSHLIRKRLQSLLSKNLFAYNQIVIDTVERIQGQERDMVIISLTTSDTGYAAQHAEFYFQPNRLNVAITRPRVKRIIIGSPVLFNTMPPDNEHKKWVNLFKELCSQAREISITPELSKTSNSLNKKNKIKFFLGFTKNN
jgi:DNA replication ATP-dependent helicase Dna2